MDRSSWIKSVKVGDVVCDCRFKHCRIADLSEEKYLRGWIKRALAYVPFIITDMLEQKLYQYEFFLELWDKTVTFEDGTSCSLRYCCDPVDHDESSHKIE